MPNSKRIFTMRDWNQMQQDRLLPVIQKMKYESDMRELASMGVPMPGDGAEGAMPEGYHMMGDQLLADSEMTGQMPNSVEGSSEGY
jgi:hypothetical protein